MRLATRIRFDAVDVQQAPGLLHTSAAVVAQNVRRVPRCRWRSSMRLFRVIVPVSDIGAAARFYEELLGLPGKRVSSGRHYIDCEGTILALFSPR
jgi:hypothetical protein